MRSTAAVATTAHAEPQQLAFRCDDIEVMVRVLQIVGGGTGHLIPSS
jgi:hypothetical protein